jgi:hypothetical protein
MNLISTVENPTSNEGHAIAALKRAVADLRALGIIATVENAPLLPLAMGNHEPLIVVRRAIDHALEAAKRGGYEIGPKCAHCGRRAGQEPCDWIECAALSPGAADA